MMGGISRKKNGKLGKPGLSVPLTNHRKETSMSKKAKASVIELSMPQGGGDMSKRVHAAGLTAAKARRMAQTLNNKASELVPGCPIVSYICEGA